MLEIAFALLTIVQSSQPASPADIKDALAHADALYYGARFNESIALLARVDESLKTAPGRVQEKVDTKLRLALGYLGINDTTKAKASLLDLYTLDPNYALDARQFPPKVISAAADAKAEQAKMQCFAAQTEGRSYIETGNTTAFLNLIRSQKSKCAALMEIEAQAADAFYKAGMSAYKRGDLSNAVTNLEATLALSPEHELALQYLDLIQNKEKLVQDRRKALSTLVENWNRTCPTSDTALIGALQGQIAALVPDPDFGKDIRAQMKDCTPPKKVEDTPPPAPAPSPSPARPVVQAASVNQGCFDTPVQIALTRLKTRVDPVLPPEIRNYLKTAAEISVRVKVRIDESGNTAVVGVKDGNPILNTVVSTAVAQWKFVPSRDQNGTRCVDTEIPMLIKIGR